MGVGLMVHCGPMWGIAIALFFGREPLLLLFTQDPEVVAIGSRIANPYTGVHRPSVNSETHGGARSLRRSPGHRDAIGTRIASSLRPDAGRWGQLAAGSLAPVARSLALEAALGARGRRISRRAASTNQRGRGISSVGLAAQ